MGQGGFRPSLASHRWREMPGPEFPDVEEGRVPTGTLTGASVALTGASGLALNPAPGCGQTCEEMLSIRENSLIRYSLTLDLGPEPATRHSGLQLPAPPPPVPPGTVWTGRHPGGVALLGPQPQAVAP